ncbi:MAG: glucose-1-phosphate cytidylyltransferase [Pseudomonadota bacterium]
MKTVILAGGLGTRISEETSVKPKPMILIGGKPILWHIMKLYSHYGLNDFVICLGYKGYAVKEYFINYYNHMSDLTVDLENDSVKIHNNYSEPWRVTLINTGEATMTGGRLKRIEDYLQGEENFCMTYGDGLSNVDIPKLISFHENHGKVATLTAVQPAGRYGSLEIDGNTVKKFQEKPKGDGGYVNGGFFVLSKDAFNFIEDDNQAVFEQEPLKRLAQENQLEAYQHHGFWHSIDTLRDKKNAETMWQEKTAPWKVWK